VLFNIPSTRAYAQTVFASSAVLGLAVGFAARSTLANFVAGVMIAVNQPVRLGDRVQVGDADGLVEDIGLTYTRLRTTDNRRVLIPNEELANSRVRRSSYDDVLAHVAHRRRKRRSRERRGSRRSMMATLGIVVMVSFFAVIASGAVAGAVFVDDTLSGVSLDTLKADPPGINSQ